MKDPLEEGYADPEHLEAKAEFLDELVRLIRSRTLVVRLETGLERPLTIEEVASIVRRGG